MKEDAEPSRYELKVSLRLSHDEPRDLGGLLRQWGLGVKGEWQTGQPCRAPNGRLLEGVRRNSYAYVQLPLPAIGWFEQALRTILDGLEPVRHELREFVDAGGRAELFVFWTFDANSGGTVDWRIARRLADFGLDLSLDVYP